MSIRSNFLPLITIVMAGCFGARADGPRETNAKVAMPGSCDVTSHLIGAYFGSKPQEQLGYRSATEGVIGSHVQYLCRAGETPLLEIEQSPFIRCVWYQAFEDPIVISLDKSCTIISRRSVDINGRYQVEEVRHALTKSECSRLLTAALVATKDGAGQSALPQGMSGLDGDALFFEYRDGALRRAGYVDTPVVDEGATGAVKACLLVQEPLRMKSVPAPR